MWGEVPTPFSRDRMSLSNIHMGLSALLHECFPDKGLFASTVRSSLKETSSDLQKEHFLRHSPVHVLSDARFDVQCLLEKKAVKADKGCRKIQGLHFKI